MQSNGASRLISDLKLRLSYKVKAFRENFWGNFLYVVILSPLGVLFIWILSIAWPVFFPPKPPAPISFVDTRAVHKILKEAALAQMNENEHPEKADALYFQALAEARRHHLKRDEVECLCRIVGWRLDSHRFKGVDELTNQAMAAFNSINGTTLCDSYPRIWMIYMADAFYDYGERSSNVKMKEYCMRRYLDAELPLKKDIELDSRLVSRAAQFCTYLWHCGKYKENVPYIEGLVGYIDRTTPGQAAQLPQYYLCPPRAYLFAGLPQAEKAYSHYLALVDKDHTNLTFESSVARELALAKLFANDIPGARQLCSEAMQKQAQISEQPVANNDFTMGVIEQRAGNLDDAFDWFGKSLMLFQNMQPKASPLLAYMHPEGDIYAGRVLSAEHLAQIAKAEGNEELAKKLELYANKIRKKITYWQTIHNPDSERVFLILGRLPFTVDFLPTHLKSTTKSKPRPKNDW